MHPVWRRCSSVKYSRYSRSSRLASRPSPPSMHAPIYEMGSSSIRRDRADTQTRGRSRCRAEGGGEADRLRVYSGILIRAFDGNAEHPRKGVAAMGMRTLTRALGSSVVLAGALMF